MQVGGETREPAEILERPLSGGLALEIIADLDQPLLEFGTVTFVVTNTGDLIDSLQVFADTPQSAGTTPELTPGQTARLTVRFTVKGIAYYQSGDYPPAEPEFGGDYGEGGQLTVT